MALPGCPTKTTSMNPRIPFTLLLAAFGLPASAATVNIQAGASESGNGDRERAPVLFLQVMSDSPRALLDRFELRPVATIGAIRGRNSPGDRAATVLAGGGLRIGFVDSGVQGWFVESQVLLNTNETASLSGHVQFGNGIGYRGRQWELMLRHVSNARLKKPNHGETMLLVGYRF